MRDWSRASVSAVAVAGLVAVLAGCGWSGSSADATSSLSGSFEPSASAAPASPSKSPGRALSASAPATLDPASTGWKRVPDQPALGGASLYDVVWTGSRYLALDHEHPEAVFDSDTGLAWHGQPALPNASRWGGPSILGAGPDGSVAIGGGVGGPLAIWHSKDGLAWTSAPDQTSLDARNGTFARVKAVIEAADRLDLADDWLAVGSERYNNAPTPGLVRAVVCTSPDGAHWRRQPDSSALLHAEMTGIVRHPPDMSPSGTSWRTRRAGIPGSFQRSGPLLPAWPGPGRAIRPRSRWRPERPATLLPTSPWTASPSGETAWSPWATSIATSIAPRAPRSRSPVGQMAERGRRFSSASTTSREGPACTRRRPGSG